MANMSQAVKRACDACHRRKVKCDGINPCRNCNAAQLTCTYNAIPQKKGPKGSRAKVISELRETQRQTSLAVKVQNRLNNIQEAPTANWLPTSGLLTAEVAKQCASFYFENLYPQLPILDSRMLEHAMTVMEQNTDSYCFLTSFTAFMVLQPGMPIPATDSYNLDMLPGANIATSQLLLEETLRVRKGADVIQPITLNSVLTNFFIFACFYSNAEQDKAWYYLREATTVMHMLGMHKEEYYQQLNDPTEAARQRRLYWLFYVIERAYAIDRHRPLTLQATVKPPSINDDPSDLQGAMMDGFYGLINVYHPFDDSFTAIWNNTRKHLNASNITNLQHRVDDVVAHYLLHDPSFTDLGNNQQWLKSMMWQLNGSSINNNGDDSIAFQFPSGMARDLLANMAGPFPNQSELITSGFIQKLLQTASSLMDLLSILPSRRSPGTITPQKHLETIIGIIICLRQGEYHYLPLLLSKASEVLPGLADPRLKNAPENASFMAMNANFDMFDGFGTAGLPQLPMHISQEPVQMSMESPGFGLDQKYSAEEYDKRYDMDMNGTPESGGISNTTCATPPVAQQSADLNNFSSSPGLMSPTMEYSNNMSNMNNFASTPMADMVHSPLGNPGQPNHMNQMQNQHQLPSQHQQHLSNGDAMSYMGSVPNGMYNMRPPQQRQGSYQQLQGQPQMRAVQDFQGLQRSEGHAGSSMMNIGVGMDFGLT